MDAFPRRVVRTKASGTGLVTEDDVLWRNLRRQARELDQACHPTCDVEYLDVPGVEIVSLACDLVHVVVGDPFAVRGQDLATGDCGQEWYAVAATGWVGSRRNGRRCASRCARRVLEIMYGLFCRLRRRSSAATVDFAPRAGFTCGLLEGGVMERPCANVPLRGEAVPNVALLPTARAQVARMALTLSPARHRARALRFIFLPLSRDHVAVGSGPTQRRWTAGLPPSTCVYASSSGPVGAEDPYDANGGIAPGFGLKVTVTVVEALVAVQPEALTAIGWLVTVSVPLPLL